MRLLMLTCLLSVAAAGQAPPGPRAAIELPKPQMSGGKPLLQALAERKSAREFAPRALPPQVLSNLLWAADGVNRPDGRRTAPSAMNRQSVDVYVVMSEGAYLYDAKAHALRLAAAGDLRAATGTQGFAAVAALDLVYVADGAKMGGSSELDRALYGGAETGFIGQNVYLFCASEGLASVVRASVNRDALARALHLRAEQRITLAQSVGYAAAP
jgi:nitroreductase